MKAMALVIAQELAPVVAGLAVGLLAAFLYEVDPRHPAGLRRRGRDHDPDGFPYPLTVWAQPC